jgi:hypothetical protein
MRVGMQRALEQLRHGRILHQLARIEDGHAIAKLRDDAQVMGDVQHSGVAGLDEIAQQVEDRSLGRHIEAGGRLIEDEKARPGAEGDGNQDALLHAAADLMGIADGHALGIGQAHHAQQLERAGARGGGVHSQVEAQPLRHLLADRDRRVEGGQGILGHQAERMAPQIAHFLFAERQQVTPLELDAPGAHPAVGVEIAHHRQGERRLARAALADQANRLAGGDRQRNLTHGVEPTPPEAIGDRQVLDPEGRGHIDLAGAQLRALLRSPAPTTPVSAHRPSG